MAVSYVQDPSELARIVQQGLMGGMQLRQRRDAMSIQEAELEAQRQRDLARQAMQEAQFGFDQQKFAADQEQQALGNAVSNAYLTLAQSKFAEDKKLNEQERESAVRTRRALQARIIDRLQKTGQGDPITIGHVWDTEDLPTLRAWDESATKMERGKVTLEGMRKNARGMKSMIDGIVKPDGTPDSGKQAQLKFLADNIEDEKDYERFNRAFDDAMKMQAEAQAAQQEAAHRQQLQATVGALVQRKRAGQPLTPEEEGLLVTTPSVNQYEMQQPDPAGGNRAAMESARKQLEVAKQNLSAAADYANTTIADDGEQRLNAAQKYYDAAFAAYQRAASGAQTAQGQQNAQKGSTGNMPPELVDKARMLRQQGLTPDQIKASLEADGWRFQ